VSRTFGPRSATPPGSPPRLDTLDTRRKGALFRLGPRQAQGKQSENPLLLGKGVKVRLARGIGRGIMHHKFAIFDGKLLVTGSYNWTDSAERYNHENVLVLEDPAIINRYQTRFNRLFNGSPTLAGRRLSAKPFRVFSEG